jgi:tRNA(Arg) A34 adenosine deaminase TadA
MMCLAASTWAHIPRIFYACSSLLVPSYNESSVDIQDVNKESHHRIKLIHLKELQPAALRVIEDFESGLRTETQSV